MSITDDTDYIHTWAEGASVTRWVAKGWSSYGAVQASAARGSELSEPSSDTMVMSPTPPHKPQSPQLLTNNF